MGRTGDVIVKDDGTVMKWSSFFGRYMKSSYPAVDLARHETLKKFLRGNHINHGITDEEREIADSFDVEKAIKDITEAREAAGLPTETNSK